MTKCKNCVHYDAENCACMYGEVPEPVTDDELSCTVGKTKEQLRAAQERVDDNPEGWEDC